jgi:uncharacterized coiled-coil protein SlyX
MLQEADYDTTALAYGKDEEKLIVRFFKHPHKNEHKTEEEGRPIYDDIDYVSIRIPGDKTSEILRPIRAEDKLRFPKHWLQYQTNETQGISGTPLTEWPAISRSQVEELAFFNVKTVEQLAELSDVHCQKWPGVQSLKVRAKAFLEMASSSTAPIERLSAALEERDNIIATMRQQMADLQNSVDELKKSRKKSE